MLQIKGLKTNIKQIDFFTSFHNTNQHKNRLMAEKSKELGDAANKLKNGLEKIDDTREKVCASSSYVLSLLLSMRVLAFV